MTELAVVGECMIELRHLGEDRLALGYAGDVANAAVYLARWALPGDVVRFLSLTGDDVSSDALLGRLEAEGVDVSAVVRLPGRTPGLYLVRVDAAGERSFTYHRAQSPAREIFGFEHAEAHAHALARADWAWLSAITLSLLDDRAHRRLLGALDVARVAGTRVAFDTNYRPAGWPDAECARARVRDVLERTDLALPTLDDERALFADADAAACAERLHRLGVAEVVVKLGAAGALVSDADGATVVASVPVDRVVDTTGAGDAFGAGYLSMRLRGAAPATAAAQGARLAAAVVGEPGGILPAAATPPPGPVADEALR